MGARLISEVMLTVGINEVFTLSLFLVTVSNPFNDTNSHLLKGYHIKQQTGLRTDTDTIELSRM
jgi:hypothetical protein